MRVVEILTNGVPRTVCEGCSDKPDKEPPPPFQGVIPNQTLKNLMGEKRWSKMLKFIKSKYGSRRIHFGHHKNGAVAYITKTHKQLGGVAKLETMMKKEKKK